jgi:hypothetical protein
MKRVLKDYHQGVSIRQERVEASNSCARILIFGSVGILQTGYSCVQASSQDKGQGVHPHVATRPVAPDLVQPQWWAPMLPRVAQLRTLPLRTGEAPVLTRVPWPSAGCGL